MNPQFQGDHPLPQGPLHATPPWPAPPPPPPRPPVPTRTLISLVLGAAALGVLLLAAILVIATGDDRAKPADIFKILIALAAAGLALMDAGRAALSVKLPKAVMLVVAGPLAIAALLAYFNAFQFGYAKFYHRWEQYHAYVGAKYFPELGYDKLYRCAAVAEDELGRVTYTKENGAKAEIDLRAEVRREGVTVRDMNGAHLLVPALEMLDHPEVCKDAFSPVRWDDFKSDVTFFRTESDRGYWEDMQRDHGFTMPPVWTISGRFFAELHRPSVGYMQFLGCLDLLYLAAMFSAIGWAFGVRVAAVAIIFWGCQAIAPFYWTGGAFLRQDWLFYLVFSTCLLRKRWYRLSGAALVYACLLRIFPFYAAAGWGLFAAVQFFRTRRLGLATRRVLVGGALAAAVLIPTSVAVAGLKAYPTFYERAVVYQETPLTNHMGLRVLVSQDLGSGPGSGRMEIARDPTQLDAFAAWKRLRIERYQRFFWIGWAVIALSMSGFVLVTARLRTPWLALALGQVLIVLATQLTCQNYPFLLLAAVLTRARRGLEAPLFLFAALTQVLVLAMKWNDTKYTALTAVALVLGLALVGALLKPAPWRAKANRRAGVYR